MADSFELNYVEDGDIYYGETVRENHCFFANQIFDVSEDANRTSDADEKYFRSTLQTAMDYANSTSTCLRKGDIAFVDSIYDNFDNGVINADIWTTGGTHAPTEESTGEGGYLQVQGTPAQVTSSCIGDDTVNDAIDFQDGTDREVLINMETSHITGGITKLQISDGANHVDCVTNSSLSRTTIRLVFDNSGQKVTVYEGLDDTTGTEKDLSTPANWYIRFYAQGNAGPDWTGTIKVYSIGIADGSSTSSTYLSETQTISSSTIGISKVIPELTTPSITLSTSFDGGATYNDGNKVMNELTAGTNLKIRIIGTAPSSIAVASRNVQSMTNSYQLIYG